MLARTRSRSPLNCFALWWPHHSTINHNTMVIKLSTLSADILSRLLDTQKHIYKCGFCFWSRRMAKRQTLVHLFILKICLYKFIAIFRYKNTIFSTSHVLSRVFWPFTMKSERELRETNDHDLHRSSPWSYTRSLFLSIFYPILDHICLS